MISFDCVTKENVKIHNPNWPQIPDYLCRWYIGGSGQGKTNSLTNILNRKLYTDKIHLYVKIPYQAKYQFLINKHEGSGLKH